MGKQKVGTWPLGQCPLRLFLGVQSIQQICLLPLFTTLLQKAALSFTQKDSI